jgi:hypothetical protein
MRIRQHLSKPSADFVTHQYELSKTIEYEVHYEYNIQQLLAEPNDTHLNRDNFSDADEVINQNDEDVDNDDSGSNDAFSLADKIAIISTPGNQIHQIKNFSTDNPSCSCFDFSTWKLPCRHILFIRAKHNMPVFTKEMIINRDGNPDHQTSPNVENPFETHHIIQMEPLSK